jgi:hypothetical protein
MGARLSWIPSIRSVALLYRKDLTWSERWSTSSLAQSSYGLSNTRRRVSICKSIAVCGTASQRNRQMPSERSLVPSTCLVLMSLARHRNPLHAHIDPQQITMDVFAGVAGVPSLLPWIRDRLDLSPGVKLTLRPHGAYPTALRVLHQHSVWCPPPETTRQLLCSLLLLWTESPWTTSFTIVVPRILMRQWYLQSWSTVYGPFAYTSLPDDARHPLRIPVMIIHTAAHVRCLPKPPRMNCLSVVE